MQALIGVICIEYSFYRTKRFRSKDEQRDSRFPAYRRFDSQKWSRWKFYPGAMFLLPTRVVLLLLDGIFLTVIVS